MKGGKARPIAELTPRQDSERGYWQYSDYFARVDACYQWKVRPSEFGLCEPGEDFGLMLAFVRTKATMDAWAQQEAEDDARRKKGAVNE